MSTVFEEVQKRLEQELALRQAAQAGKLDVVEDLLNQGVEVNAKDTKSGRTALHWAANSDFLHVIYTLLQAGADRTLVDNNGNTPADLAWDFHQGIDMPSVDLLYNFFLIEKNTAKPCKFTTLPKILPPKGLQAKFRTISSKYKTFIVDKYKENNEQFLKIFNNASSKERDEKIRTALFKPLWEAHQELAALISFHMKTTTCFLSDFSEGEPDDKGKQLLFLIKLSKQRIDAIKYQRTLTTLTENILTKLEFLKIKVIKKQFKDFKKYIKNFTAIATEEMKVMIETSESIFIRYDKFMDEDHYCQFINTYFPGDLIDIIATPYESTHGKYSLDAMCDTIQNKAVLFQQIELYFKETIEKICQLSLEKRKKLMFENFYVMSIGKEPLSNLLRPAIENTFRQELDSLKNTPDDLTLHGVLPRAYLFVARYRTSLERFFKTRQDDSDRLYKEEAQILRRQFLERLETRKAQVSNFKDAQDRDKKILKEREKQERAKAVTKAEENRILTFQKMMLAENEQKQQEEKKAVAEKLLSRLTEKEDNTTHQIIELLDGNIKDLSEMEFLKMVKKLQIPGYEKIPYNINEGVSDNKLTLKLGVFYSFTLHFCHGDDRKGFVDPATVVHLKKMLQVVGITREMIEQRCVKKSPSHTGLDLNKRQSAF